MSAYSNLHFEPTPQDRLVRQVIAACAKHGVSYGSPDDLRGFLHAVDSNKHLAMDFWSMVARMSEQGAVEEPDWLLKIIVEAVTGKTLPNLTAQGSTYQIPVQQLRSLLAGEDVRTPAPDADPTARKPVRAVYSAVPAPSPAPEPNPPSPYVAGRRLSLEPDPPVVSAPHLDPQSQSPEEERNWVIPLESYAVTNRSSRRSSRFVAGALAVIALLACAAFVVQYHQRIANSLRAGTASAVDAWYGSPSGNPTAQPASTKPTAISPSTQLRAAGNHAGDTRTEPPAPESPTQPSDRPVSNHATSDQPRDSGNAMPATGGGRVVVPEILMRQNLISAPTPPTAHGNNHGTVVMQAIVTKHGNISQIHVMSGESALRQAAIRSALSRHYTPYLLNGTPVDVSTTITLDF